MTEVLQANIFFLITTIAVVVFTVFLCLAMYYLVSILRSVRNVAKRLEEGSDTIVGDMKQLRTYIVSGSLISQVIGLFTKSKRTKRRKESESDVD